MKRASDRGSKPDRAETAQTGSVHESPGARKRNRPETGVAAQPHKGQEQTERQVQRSILQMFGYAFPNVLVWHVPNGAYLGANEVERKRTMGILLGDGLKPGAPDLAIYWNHGHALIEVKRPGYSPSDVSLNQKLIHAELAEMGWSPEIVTSPEEAFAFLKSKGAPTNIVAWRAAA